MVVVEVFGLVGADHVERNKAKAAETVGEMALMVETDQKAMCTKDQTREEARIFSLKEHVSKERLRRMQQVQQDMTTSGAHGAVFANKQRVPVDPAENVSMYASLGIFACGARQFPSWYTYSGAGLSGLSPSR